MPSTRSPVAHIHRHGMPEAIHATFAIRNRAWAALRLAVFPVGAANIETLKHDVLGVAVASP